MPVEIRPAHEAELPDFFSATAYSFADNRSEEERAAQPQPLRPEWTLCAFVDGRIATTFGAYPFRVRLNGVSVAMAGVTAVTTLPEFRRRGLLREVMGRSFRDQREQGQAFAILWASMGAIYQRYGYASASTYVSYEIDPRQILFAHGERAEGSVRVVPPSEGRPIIEGLFKEFARPRNLVIQRVPVVYDIRLQPQPGQVTRVGIYENAAGEPRGYVVFHLTRLPPGPDPGPGQTLGVTDAAYLDLDAYRGLWEFFAAHDLVARVTWQGVPEDDAAPLLLLEPRELRRRSGDAIWMRVTDVEPALGARPYADAGVLSIAVRDQMCDWNNGVFTVETDGKDSEVTRADSQADLEMPVSTLAPLLAGHRPASFLARAGLLRPTSMDALTKADRMFATTYAPWCPDGF